MSAAVLSQDHLKIDQTYSMTRNKEPIVKLHVFDVVFASPPIDELIVGDLPVTIAIENQNS